MSLTPVASEQSSASSCANCGAPLVADQRYCLSCGAPASPVRLAFLDVLQGERAAVPPTLQASPAGYVTALEARGANGWLRRNSGLLGLLAVLLLCLIAGLLLGHWVSQGSSKTPAKQVVEVKGLSGLLAAPASSSPATSTTASSTPAQGASKAKEEAEEKAEAKETKAEKAPPPPPVKVSVQKIKKLTTSTGKKHEEEINSLGAQPIETG